MASWRPCGRCLVHTWAARALANTSHTLLGLFWTAPKCSRVGFWEGPRHLKITKNRLKIVAERFLGGFMISRPFREGSGRLRGRFREGFERLLGRLLEHLKTFWLPKKERIWTNMRGAFQVEGLAMMIRATSSRSMDGWMDREDLIICVAIWTLYKRRLPLTCVDLLAGSIASRKRLRLTSLCGGILVDFGSFLEPKIEAKIDLWEVFLRSFFRARFGIDFWSFF